VTQVIYKIVNLVNDKFYVGSTNNQRERFRTHRNKLRRGVHHCAHLQASWNKYGEEKFTFKVIANVPDGESLQEAEDAWLISHVGKSHCYNAGLRSGAPMRGIQKERHPNFGKPISEEQRQQISTTLKDFYAQDYFNHPRVGKQHTEETKAKISAAKMANPVAPWEGKQRSEETKAKIGDTQRGKPKGPGRKVSEAGKAKIRANIEAGRSHMHWLGRTHTEEAKEKMRKKVLEQTSGQMFDSLTAVLEHYQMTMPTLRRALISGKPISKGKFVGCVFVYA
jgi:group I intron endonuclease